MIVLFFFMHLTPNYVLIIRVIILIHKSKCLVLNKNLEAYEINMKLSLFITFMLITQENLVCCFRPFLKMYKCLQIFLYIFFKSKKDNHPKHPLL